MKTSFTQFVVHLTSKITSAFIHKSNYWYWVLLAVLLHVLLVSLLGPGYMFSDDRKYLDSALGVLNGFELPFHNTFSGRFVIFPLALALKVLPPSAFTLTLTATIFSVITILIIALIFKPIKYGLFGVFIFSISKMLVYSSHIFFPDIFSIVFQLAALIAFKTYLGNKSPRFFLGSILLIYCAVLIKISALPTALGIMLFYLIRAFYWRHFLYGLLLVTGITLCLLWYYEHFFNDSFFRLNVIENEYNVSKYSFYNVSPKILIKRVLFGPISILIANPLYAFCFSITLALFIKLKNDIFSNFWLYISLFVLLFSWFGTTSLSTYNPLGLVPRMWFFQFIVLFIVAFKNLNMVSLKTASFVLFALVLYSFAQTKYLNGIALSALLIMIWLFRKNSSKALMLTICLSVFPAIINLINTAPNNLFAAIQLVRHTKTVDKNIPIITFNRPQKSPKLTELTDIEFISVTDLHKKEYQEFVVIEQANNQITIDKNTVLKYSASTVFTNDYFNIRKYTLAP